MDLERHFSGFFVNHFSGSFAKDFSGSFVKDFSGSFSGTLVVLFRVRLQGP